MKLFKSLTKTWNKLNRDIISMMFRAMFEKAYPDAARFIAAMQKSDIIPNTDTFFFDCNIYSKGTMGCKSTESDLYEKWEKIKESDREDYSSKNRSNSDSEKTPFF